MRVSMKNLTDHIDPLGYVPYLVLDDGRTLHEGPAIVQYIADQVPHKQLAPANGSWERYKLQVTSALQKYKSR